MKLQLRLSYGVSRLHSGVRMAVLGAVKRGTLNDLVYERTQTVLLLAHFRHNFLNGRAVGEPKGPSHGVGQQLLGQSRSDLVDVVRKQFFEPSNVLKRLAIGCLSRGIDGPS